MAGRERQLSAKLHCLYGVPIDVNWKVSDRSETLDATESMEAVTKIYRCINPYARSRVYDLRRYTAQTFWGPFVDDASEHVDWEMLESIMVVLGYNLGMFSERTRGLFGPVWDKPFEGAVPGSFVPPPKDEPFCSKHTRHDSGLAEAPALIKEPSLSLDARDPYGITGTWRRVSSPPYSPSIQLGYGALTDGKTLRLSVSSITTTSTASTFRTPDRSRCLPPGLP